jgi:hypothetical protein
MIEIGDFMTYMINLGCGSFIRVLDEGGLVWESDKPYTSIDQALTDAEQAIAEWLDSH